MASKITQTVILAAGLGSRLRNVSQEYLKPLYPLKGKPLIAYVMEAFAANGVTDFHIVVGFEKEELAPGLEAALPTGTKLHLIDNEDYKLANGISLLKAEGHLSGRFFLSMSDHLFMPEMVDRLAQGALDEESLYLAVDYKLDSIFDMDDATKVQIEGDKIRNIDKSLDTYNAIDTGLFVCPEAIFGHLRAAADKQDGNCSLSDGVRTMASADRSRVVDVGDAFWQDVDTPEMHGHAERWLAENSGG